MSSLYIYALLYAMFNVAGAALIKHKLLVVNIATIKDFFLFLVDFKVIAAMGLIFCSMFFSIKALSFDRFTLIIPVLTGVNFIVTIAVGYLFFSDQINLTGYVGIMFILLGIYLMGVS